MMKYVTYSMRPWSKLKLFRNSCLIPSDVGGMNLLLVLDEGGVSKRGGLPNVLETPLLGVGEEVGVVPGPPLVLKLMLTNKLQFLLLRLPLGSSSISRCCSILQGSNSFRGCSLPSRHPHLEDVVGAAVVDEVGAPLPELKTDPVLLLLPSKIIELSLMTSSRASHISRPLKASSG